MRTAGAANAYVIESLQDGRKYVQADRQVIFTNNPENWGKELESYINSSIRNGEDVEFVTEDGDVIKITEDTAWKIGDMSKWSKERFPIKMNMGTHIDELLEVSKHLNNKDAGDRTGKRFKPDSFDHRTAFFRDFNGDYYRVHISVGVFEDGKIAYSIGKDIQKRSFPGANGSSSENQRRSNTKKASNKRITYPEGNVNTYNMQNEKNNSDKKTEMQIALEKAGIDSSMFEGDVKNSVTELTDEQREAVREAERLQEKAGGYIRHMGEKEKDDTSLSRKLDRAAMRWVDRFQFLKRFDKRKTSPILKHYSKGDKNVPFIFLHKTPQNFHKQLKFGKKYVTITM